MAVSAGGDLGCDAPFWHDAQKLLAFTPAVPTREAPPAVCLPVAAAGCACRGVCKVPLPAVPGGTFQPWKLCCKVLVGKGLASCLPWPSFFPPPTSVDALPLPNFDFSHRGSPSIIPDQVPAWIGNCAAYDGVLAASKLGVS